MVRGFEDVHLHQGDGVETSICLWREAGRPASVLFLVDGDHSEQSVHRELGMIVAEVPAPAVLLHDTFNQPAQAGYNIGPHKAIAQVLASHPGRFRRLESGLGLPGMTFLYVA